MTPEQLADRAANIGDLFDRQIEALGPELAYELRRLAAENAALLAEAMRFREDALNEQAARKALEAALAERQGEAVPYEKFVAIREGHFNAASEEYFDARPQLDSAANRRIFYAGHCKGYDAAPAQQPLSEREVELIDGMIEVQLDHAGMCDTILSRPNGNHQMAEKQKGWDMERVTLLRKLKAAHGIGGEK